MGYRWLHYHVIHARVLSAQAWLFQISCKQPFKNIRKVLRELKEIIMENKSFFENPMGLAHFHYVDSAFLRTIYV